MPAATITAVNSAADAELPANLFGPEDIQNGAIFKTQNVTPTNRIVD